MQYSVIAPDGSRYGPADLSLLNQWANEGRIDADTELEEFGTMRRVRAGQVSGLVIPMTQRPADPIPQQQPYATPAPRGYEQPSQPYGSPQVPQQNWQQPPSYANYQRPQAEGGQGELTAAWILGAVTFAFCCPVLPAVGLVMANKSISLGNTSANAARIFNLVVLILSSLLYLGYILFFVFAISMAGR